MVHISEGTKRIFNEKSPSHPNTPVTPVLLLGGNQREVTFKLITEPEEWGFGDRGLVQVGEHSKESPVVRKNMLSVRN